MDEFLKNIAENIWASLGPGYSESVYHCAFEVALRKAGVYYENQNVGHVRADLIIDRKYVVELKSVSKLNEIYRIQTRNYIKLLDLDEGFLINFPEKSTPLEFERIILSQCIPTPIPDI